MKGLRHLEVAISQVEAEILDDRAILSSIVEDPSIFNYEKPTDVSYAIHDRAHHLANHTIAIQILKGMREEILNSLQQVNKDGGSSESKAVN